eukprot:4973208-Lingulodinium_polyedra.AAC.1
MLVTDRVGQPRSATSDPESFQRFCKEVASNTDKAALEQQEGALQKSYLDRLVQWFQTFLNTDGSAFAVSVAQRLQQSSMEKVQALLDSLRDAFGANMQLCQFWGPDVTPEELSRARAWVISPDYAKDLTAYAEATSDKLFHQE